MSEERHEHFPEYSPVHSHQDSLECSNQQPDPAIFSETHVLVFSEKVSSEKIQQALTLWVEEIREWAKDKDYLVGHIKLFVDGQENLWLSSTGKNINIKHSQGWSEWVADRVNLSVTAIIFGTLKEALGEAAQESLQACLKRIDSDIKGTSLFPVIP